MYQEVPDEMNCYSSHPGAASPEGPAEAVFNYLVEDLFTLLQFQALPPGAPFGLKYLEPKKEDKLLQG